MDRCTCGRHRRPIATRAQQVARELVLEYLAWEATQNPDVEARAFARREYERRMAWLPQTLRNLDLDKYYGDEVRDCPEARRPSWDYERDSRLDAFPVCGSCGGREMPYSALIAKDGQTWMRCGCKPANNAFAA